MAGSIPASPTVEAVAAPAARPRHFSPWREAWRRFHKHKLAVVGGVILLLIVFAVLLGPWIWQVPINEIIPLNRIARRTT